MIKKKLLVLLIAASSMLMPNLASAIAIDVGAGEFTYIPFDSARR
jgi:hypothetical protein